MYFSIIFLALSTLFVLVRWDKMMKNNKTVLSKIFIFIFAAVTLVTVFLTHRAVPFMMDDLWYSTILASDKPLSGIGDIPMAQLWHYLNWGGRSMTHTILQLILINGQMFADVLNTVVTVILSCVILLAARDVADVKIESFSEYVLWITMIIGCLHGLNANWRMSMYWQSGSANYLYITIFVLLFIWAYVRELKEEEPALLKGINFWIIPVAILAGWSNENMGPTAWLISLFVMIYLKKKARQVRSWMIVGSILSFIGSAMCILAPGNFVRSAEAAEEGKGIIWRLYLRLYSECRGAFDYLFPVAIVALLFATIYFGVMKNKADLKIIVYASAAVIACGAMILSPHYPDRATFGSLVLLLVVIIAIALKLAKSEERSKLWLILPGTLIWLHGMFYLMEYLGMSYGWIL